MYENHIVLAIIVTTVIIVAIAIIVTAVPIVVIVRAEPGPALREMGGAPRSPALRNHFLVWIVKHISYHSCHTTTQKDRTRDRRS